MKIKISFNDLEHFWICMKIEYGEDAINIVGSYTPYDSFLNLVDALRLLLDLPIDSKVIWNEEPIEYELQFSGNNDRIRLEIYRYQNHARSIDKGEKVIRVT